MLQQTYLPFAKTAQALDWIAEVPTVLRLIVLKTSPKPGICLSAISSIASGVIRLCLFGNTGINIRHLMQKDSQIEELKDLILKQLNFKKESHYLEIGETGLTKNLSTTGG